MRLCFILFIVCLFNSFYSKAQFVNNGANVYLNENSLLYINEDFINNSGDVVNKGTIEIVGNFLNYSNEDFFKGGFNGIVNLVGNNQIIGGTSKTKFGKLYLSGIGIKKLTIDQIVVTELNIYDSELNVDNNILHLQNSNPNSLKRNSGYVTSNILGGLKRNLYFNDSYLFPLAFKDKFNIVKYRPLNIDNYNSENSSYTTSVLPTSLLSTTIDISIVEDGVTNINYDYFFRIKRNEGIFPVGITFNFNAIEDGDLNTVLNLKHDPLSLNIITNQSNEQVLINKLIVNNWNNFKYEEYFLGNVDYYNKLIIPNAISSNNDGKNDIWKIKGIEYFPNNKVKIFNRWGSEVYNKVNYANEDGWKADNVNSGTYFYLLTINPNTKFSKIYKGFITVIK